jgi:hypothetical protein
MFAGRPNNGLKNDAKKLDTQAARVGTAWLSP